MNLHVEHSVSVDDRSELVSFNRFVTRRSFYQVAGKRILDCALIALALPVVLPLVILFGLLAMLDGHGPLYWQERLGRNGKVFYLVKIRTMVPNADRILDEYLASNSEARREWNFRQKLYNDPRITRVGAFIRKSSMDELPQLWNVLCGHMSLVGPRPMMVEQKALYDSDVYYRMRPGITGLWQITERNNCGFSERAVYDAEYYSRLSFKEDLNILLKTVRVVISGTGY